MKNTLNSIFKIVSASIATIAFVGCSNSSSLSDGTKSTTPDTNTGGCFAELPPGADNMMIAQAFNQYRNRCHPNEIELEREIAKLNETMKRRLRLESAK